jgi:hypothetical protein
VITDRHREVVTGLSQSDFTVLETASRKRPNSLRAHVPSPAAATPAQVPLPAYEYSNASSATPNPINIVLFDLLDTPLIDQPYARAQMVQFLKTRRDKEIACLSLEASSA